MLQAGSRVAHQTDTRQHRRDASSRATQAREHTDARNAPVQEWSGLFFLVFGVVFFCCATSTIVLFFLPFIPHPLTSQTPPCIVAVLFNSYNAGSVWGPVGHPLVARASSICLRTTCPAAVSLYSVGMMLGTVRATCPAAVAVFRYDDCIDCIALTVVLDYVSLYV